MPSFLFIGLPKTKNERRGGQLRWIQGTRSDTCWHRYSRKKENSTNISTNTFWCLL